MDVINLKPSPVLDRLLVVAEREFALKGITGADLDSIAEQAQLPGVAAISDCIRDKAEPEALAAALVCNRLPLMNDIRWVIIDRLEEAAGSKSYKLADDGRIAQFAPTSPLRLGELLYASFYPMCWQIGQVYPDNFYSTFLLQYNVHSPNGVFRYADQPWFSSLMYCINFAEKKLTALLGSSEEAMERIYFAAHQLQSMFALEESSLRSGTTTPESLLPLARRIITAAGRQTVGDVDRIQAEIAMPEEHLQAQIDAALSEREFRARLRAGREL